MGSPNSLESETPSHGHMGTVSVALGIMLTRMLTLLGKPYYIARKVPDDALKNVVCLVLLS